MEEVREAGGTWRISGLLFPGQLLIASSCYFVALVVLLRLLAITQPIGYDTLHQKIGIIGSIAIWVFSLLLNLIPMIISLPPYFEGSLYNSAHLWVFRLCSSVPVLLTLFLYGLLLYKVKQIGGGHDTSTSQLVKRQLAQMANMIQGIVIWVVICNVPYIAWWEWTTWLYEKTYVSPNRITFQDAFNSNAGVQKY